MNHPQPVTDIGIAEIQFGAVANVDVLVRCGASSRKTLAHLDSPRAPPDWVHEYVDSLFHIILQLDIGVRMLFTRPVDLLSGAWWQPWRLEGWSSNSCRCIDPR